MKRLFKPIGVIITALALVLLAACSAASTVTWQEQYDLGMKYLSEGNYQEAIMAFTAAIEIDPKNATIYLGRAAIYEKLERYEEALADYDFVMTIEDKPEEILVEACMGRAGVYEELERYEDAIEDYSTVILLPSLADWLKSLRVDAYLSRAWAYGLLDRKDDAIADYRKVIELLGDPETLDEKQKAKWELCRQRLEELGVKEPTERKELSQYLGADIAAVYSDFVGIERVQTSDGSIEYSNGNIIISSWFNYPAVEFISLEDDPESKYSLYQIEIGQSVDEAIRILENGYPEFSLVEEKHPGMEELFGRQYYYEYNHYVYCSIENIINIWADEPGKIKSVSVGRK